MPLWLLSFRPPTLNHREKKDRPYHPDEKPNQREQVGRIHNGTDYRTKKNRIRKALSEQRPALLVGFTEPA